MSEQSYLNLLSTIRHTGESRPDRTGTGTRSIFGPQLKFNLKEGFPLLTTKKMFFKGVVAENLWFIRGDTNIKFLTDNGVHVWDAWADKNGDLGPVYGKQLRRIERRIWVARTCGMNTPTEIPVLDKTVVLDPTSPRNTRLYGYTVQNGGSPFTVVAEEPATNVHNHTRFRIKFHKTGSVRVVSYNDVMQGTPDYYEPSVFGVGLYGDCDSDDPDFKMISDTWREMLRRCYYPKSKAFAAYGKKGVFVDAAWRILANFQRDVKKLPGWHLKQTWPADYSLDKDVSGSNVYSKAACRWASKEEQGLNTSTGTPFTAVDPVGREHLFSSYGDAQRKYGLTPSAVHRCLDGRLHTHKGWSAFNYAHRSGQVLRTTVTDQLRNVIASLRQDPMGRRHVISLWNPADLDDMRLPPCHGNVIQFYVSVAGELSCHMYQRSADLLLGVPWNIAGYALLTHMIAQVCGLGVDTLTISFGDAHVYLNHFTQVDEQLFRKPMPLPRLVLNPEIKDVDQFGFDDIKLEGYESYPAIKAEVAV